MADSVTRDQIGDHLLTPQNAALLVIDKPSQFTAAIAVYHATGIRVRDLPITLDKLL